MDPSAGLRSGGMLAAFIAGHPPRTGGHRPERDLRCRYQHRAVRIVVGIAHQTDYRCICWSPLLAATLSAHELPYRVYQGALNDQRRR
jgi:hypothetical protein